MSETDKGLQGLQADVRGGEFVFTHGEREWVVKYRPVTWEEQWQAIEDSWSRNERDEVRFLTPGYYKTLLTACIQSIDGEQVTEKLIEGLDRDVVAKLSVLVPSPVLGVSADAVKKE